MATVVQRVVRQLDLVEQHRLRHPVRARRRAVGVYVDAKAALRLRATGRQPLRAGVLEAAVAQRHHLDQNAVVGVGVQAADGGAQRRKHATVWTKWMQIHFIDLITISPHVAADTCANALALVLYIYHIYTT